MANVILAKAGIQTRRADCAAAARHDVRHTPVHFVRRSCLHLNGHTKNDEPMLAPEIERHLKWVLDYVSHQRERHAKNSTNKILEQFGFFEDGSCTVEKPPPKRGSGRQATGETDYHHLKVVADEVPARSRHRVRDMARYGNCAQRHAESGRAMNVALLTGRANICLSTLGRCQNGSPATAPCETRS